MAEPFALCTNAVPITAVVSARRGCKAAGEHNVHGLAVAAAEPPRSDPDRVGAEVADDAFASVHPSGERPAATRTAHPRTGEVTVGVGGVADDDHGSSRCSQLISVDYYGSAGKEPVRFGGNGFRVGGVIGDADVVTMTGHRRDSGR